MPNTIKGITPGVTGQFMSNDGELNFKTSIVYRVESDVVTFDSTYILATGGLPIVRSSFITLANGLLCVCKSKKADQDKDNRKIWLVKCDFDTEAYKKSEEDGSEETQTSDPTNWTPIATLGFEEFTEYTSKDLDDNPYQNSAGEPFASGLPVKRYITVWNFTQYEPASVTYTTITDRNGKSNSASFKGYPAKTWLCLIRNAELGRKNGYEAWKIDYTLKYKASKWIHNVLDIGTFYLNGSSEKITFKDKYENRIYGNLDGTGGEETTAADVATLEFTNVETTSFSFLRV